MKEPITLKDTVEAVKKDLESPEAFIARIEGYPWGYLCETFSMISMLIRIVVKK